MRAYGADKPEKLNILNTKQHKTQTYGLESIKVFYLEMNLEKKLESIETEN